MIDVRQVAKEIEREQMQILENMKSKKKASQSPQPRSRGGSSSAFDMKENTNPQLLTRSNTLH